MNPHRKLPLSGRAKRTVESVRRLDEGGYMYCMDCFHNYYRPLIQAPIKLLGMKKGGCSAFITRNPEGHVLTGRNYDLPHLDGEGKTNGLNVVLRTAPKGKYRSVAVADAFWLTALDKRYMAGSLDDGATDTSWLLFLPYICMDGLNEKGLCVTILALDLKEGETAVKQSAKGKKTVILTMLMRFMMDSCADVEEAIRLASSYNVTSTFGRDYHLFLTDAAGNAAVLEWRHDTFTVTRCDCCTNFYVGYGDACDCYLDGKLKEKFVRPEEEYGDCLLGYGHGYERFFTLKRGIAAAAAEPSSPQIHSVMDEPAARELLHAVAQEYTDSVTSLTQYSAVYDNTALTLRVEPHQEPGQIFEFEV